MPEKLHSDKLMTGRSRALKEFLRTLRNCLTLSSAMAVWNNWYAWAERSRVWTL